VEGQSFSLAFALSGPKGSEWRSAVDCDADHRKSPFCFAAFAARLDANKDGKWSVEECEVASEASSAIADRQAATAASQRSGSGGQDARIDRRQVTGSAIA
jgi:hypothetical protein